MVTFILWDGINVEVISNQVVPGLAVGTTTSVSMTRSDTEPQSGNAVLAVIDSTGLVAEADESNNFVVIIVP